MDSRKLSIVGCESGDWEAVYLDGTLQYENHSVGWQDLVRILDLNVDGFVVSSTWLEDNGLPSNIDDIPEEAKE